jgi:NADH-quinone oxidoreductase subunit C
MMAGTDAAPGVAGEDAGDDATADSAAAAAELLHGAPVGESRGQRTVHPDRDGYPALVEALRSDGYWVCVDLCGVDFLGYVAPRRLPAGVQPERFEVVANLLDPTARRRIRVRVQVPEADPVIASISALHPGAESHERETYDLFGITFGGHPDPSRILMPEDWQGHPLRKDYAVGRIPVQFKGATTAR